MAAHPFLMWCAVVFRLCVSASFLDWSKGGGMRNRKKARGWRTMVVLVVFTDPRNGKCARAHTKRTGETFSRVRVSDRRRTASVGGWKMGAAKY